MAQAPRRRAAEECDQLVSGQSRGLPSVTTTGWRRLSGRATPWLAQPARAAPLLPACPFNTPPHNGGLPLVKIPGDPRQSQRRSGEAVTQVTASAGYGVRGLARTPKPWPCPQETFVAVGKRAGLGGGPQPRAALVALQGIAGLARRFRLARIAARSAQRRPVVARGPWSFRGCALPRIATLCPST